MPRSAMLHHTFFNRIRETFGEQDRETFGEQKIIAGWGVI